MPELHFFHRLAGRDDRDLLLPFHHRARPFHARYAVSDGGILTRSRTALTAASERVRLKFGAPCSLALGQLARIEATAARYSIDTQVYFESFKE